MKILAAVRHPGPAEAIVPVIKLLQSQGHQVVLIGLNNNSIETNNKLDMAIFDNIDNILDNRV